MSATALLDAPRTVVDDITTALSTGTSAALGKAPMVKQALRSTALVGLTVAKKPAELALAGARKFGARDANGKRHLVRNSAIAFTAAGVAAGATYVIKHWEELSEGGPQGPHVGWESQPQT